MARRGAGKQAPKWGKNKKTNAKRCMCSSDFHMLGGLVTRANEHKTLKPSKELVDGLRAPPATNRTQYKQGVVQALLCFDFL
jgi:hypothetical protein|mmetsp:Transcript_56654/g.94040  ORF Transcript_56654/g.94040 Transcript_56654/m.94040 type:complete len:82 (-) Transcript_56654:3580-3825(-)